MVIDMMAILVTGASGFIGKYVVEILLQERYKVIVLSRNIAQFAVSDENLVVVYGDLADGEEIKTEIKKYGPVGCINLAWEGIPDFSFELCSKNLKSGINLLNLCKDVGITTLISAGSCWEYKNPIGAVTEESLLSGENSFKAAKNALKLMSEAFCRENGINFYWLRIFYVYGAGQRRDSLIPYIIHSIREGKQPKLKNVFNLHDFIYVEDVAAAIFEILKVQPSQNVFNIGSGQVTKVLDIVKITAQCMDFLLDMSAYLEQKASVAFWANLAVITDSTNWRPKTSIKDGISKTIQILNK